jgi:hypothetical protein
MPLTVENIITARRALAASSETPTRMPAPVSLPATLYDKAQSEGIDMAGYVRDERIRD